MNREPVQAILSKKTLDTLYDTIADIGIYITEYGANRIPDKLLINLRNALKGLFTDYSIGSVYLSDNTDKEFFGVFIKRSFNIAQMIVTDDMRDIYEDHMYDIDIDSKLFTMMGIGTREIASFIMYDMYRILSHEATLEVASVYDMICSGKGITFSKKMIGKTWFEVLFKFCASDYLYRSHSIFTHNEDELVRIPEILSAYELDATFIDATEKLFNHDYMVAKKCAPPAALSMNWMISVIDRYEPKTAEILDVVNDFNTTTGSTLIKNMMHTIAKQLMERNMKASYRKMVNEASLFSGIRKNGLKSLENDLFEYEMRVKNIEDENSAIFLMRQINSRMGIIQDYLEEEKIPEAEMKRWQKLYDRYEKLRIAMTHKPIYSKKMYGLFVDYNALMSQTNDNMMTMNTIY